MHLRLSHLQSRHWIGLTLVTLIAAAIGWYAWRETAVGDWIRGFSISAVIARIQALGPWVFFSAVAVLPAFGFPVMAFYLVAGKSFGMPLALAGCLGAIAVNVALSYGLARSVMHPVVVWLVRKTGREVPQVRPENRWILAWLLRVTPGPPFFMQSYLLALGGVPFGIYMIVSVTVAWVYGGAFIVFGDTLLSGHAGRIATGVGVLVAVILVIRLLRRRLQARAAADPTLAPQAGEPRRATSGE